MNVYEIEALIRAAESLRNYMSDTKVDQVHNQLLDRVSAELGKVETADEVVALQRSSNIKQANLNLLAGKALALVKSLETPVFSVFAVRTADFQRALEELETLAKNLIQEEPASSAEG